MVTASLAEWRKLRAVKVIGCSYRKLQGTTEFDVDILRDDDDEENVSKLPNVSVSLDSSTFVYMRD